MNLARFLSCAVLLLGIIGQSAVASVDSQRSPVVMLRETSDQLISDLQKNKADLSRNQQYIYQLTRKILLPHVDSERMARSVLARSVWAQATVKQRREFTQQFTQLLVATYASALAAYDDQKVKYLPLRVDPSQQRILEVHSLLVSNKRPDVRVSYRVIRQGNEWKVFDLTVEGISLLQSFRNQFAATAKQGMNALIKKLATHNVHDQLS